MQSNRIIGIGLVACVLAASLAFSAEQRGSQIEQIRRGWQVFNEKLCISCHAVWGEGERVGPDLGRIKTEFLSAGQLAGVMWNHAPDMWSRMISKGIPVQGITKEEMESLFLFLYFARFMDEPGDPREGAALVYRKKCVICHATEPGEASVGPNFHTLGAQVNAMVWAQKMWNHAPPMYEEMRARGFAWPTFEGREMANLIAHVQSIAGGLERTYLDPGDRERGRKAFEDAGCASCHEAGINPDAPKLGYMARNPRTINEMAGLMWNHAPDMVRAAKSVGVEWPEMTAQQIVDLIAYFFSLRFYRETGDVANGRRLFSEKHCSACHSGTGGARNLRETTEPTSAIQMARFMWQHGVEMLQKMEEMRVSWPTFDKDEFVDLLAYLNAEVEPAEGRPGRK